jgi:hypothetical protein
MRHKSPMRAIAIACAAIILAGCGADKSESLPSACVQGPGAVMKALAKAPGAVALEGRTPISLCFNRGANSNDVQIVGTNLLSAAQQLGDRARGGDQQAALRLGYLVGAAQRGAKRNGLGDEIVRRLEAETTVGAARQAAYNRGLRAGRSAG